MIHKVSELCNFIYGIFETIFATFYAIIDVVMNLGNLVNGNELSDTNYALERIIESFIKKTK